MTDQTQAHRSSVPCRRPALEGLEEPALEDLLADPLLATILQGDRVNLGEFEALIAAARARLAASRGGGTQSGSSSESQ